MTQTDAGKGAPEKGRHAQHQLVRTLIQRRAARSTPGSRTDGRFIALAIEGGSMRGVVSGGMVSALEQLGFLDCFDTVLGSSAGALAAAYFTTRQARFGTTIYYEDINNRSFINPWRLLAGKPIVSLEYLLDDVCVERKPLAFDRLRQSPIPLHVLASSIDQCKSVILSGFEHPTDIFTMLRASARIPFFAGPPVSFRGEKFLDASVYEPIPVNSALTTGATDVVALLTRPADVKRPPPGFIDRNIIGPYLRRFDARFARDYLDRSDRYNETVSKLAASTSDESSNILAIQVATGTPKVDSNETLRSALVEGAKSGHRAVYRAFGEIAPHLSELIMPVDAEDR